MAFRDDRDALLARNEALDREVAELKAERDQAIAARDEAVAERDALSEQVGDLRSRLDRASPARRERGSTRRPRGLLVAGLPIAAILVAGVIGYCSVRKPRQEPAKPVAGAMEDAAVAAKPPAPVPVSSLARPLHMCLSRGDLLARVVIANAAAGARVSPQYDDADDGIAQCAGWMERLRDGEHAIPPELGALVERYRAAITEVGEAWATMLRLIGSGDADAPGGAEKLAAARQRVNDAGARFLPLSRALRLAAGPVLVEAFAARRAELADAEPGARAFFEVGVRASALLDAIALGSAAEVQAALDDYLSAREDPGYQEPEHAVTFTRFVREAAAAVIAARPTGDPGSDAGAVAEAAEPNPALPAEATHPLSLALSYFQMAGLRPL